MYAQQSSGEATSAPASPIESRMTTHEVQLNALLNSIENLEASIRGILENVPPMDAKAGNQNPLAAASSCPLEEQLRTFNNTLDMAVNRVNSIRNRVRL